MRKPRAKAMEKNIHKSISAERSQTPDTRVPLFAEVEKHLGGRTLVSFSTSFRYPVEIDDDDCDMLQSILQTIDVSKGLALMISSPGGDGLAAERIVNTCRAYSGTGDYWAVVPGRAKSAATIVCMGASKIFMAASSELGPVDPQILRREPSGYRQFSAYSLVSGYTKLFKEAVKASGNLEPYIQQLQKYDVREINNYADLIKLSEHIAVKILKSGCMPKKSSKSIRKAIEIFLDPKKGTISHGRSITRDETRDCGLPVENLDVHSDSWRAIYELYARTETFVSSVAAKAVESREDSFMTYPPSEAA
jgi:serine dehydrogenase proteinase